MYWLVVQHCILNVICVCDGIIGRQEVLARRLQHQREAHGTLLEARYDTNSLLSSSNPMTRPRLNMYCSFIPQAVPWSATLTAARSERRRGVCVGHMAAAQNASTSTVRKWRSRAAAAGRTAAARGATLTTATSPRTSARRTSASSTTPRCSTSTTLRSERLIVIVVRIVYAVVTHAVLVVQQSVSPGSESC